MRGAARPGETLEIGGPRGWVVVSDSFDWWLLVGDETAPPAIGRRVEEAAPGSRMTRLVTVTGPEEEQPRHPRRPPCSLVPPSGRICRRPRAAPRGALRPRLP